MHICDAVFVCLGYFKKLKGMGIKLQLFDCQNVLGTQTSIVLDFSVVEKRIFFSSIAFSFHSAQLSY